MCRRRAVLLVLGGSLLSVLLLAGATGCGGIGPVPVPGAEPEIQFWASEQVVPHGGCTLLHWEVSGAEDYPIFFNGDEVAATGQVEMCLEESTTFELVVGTPGGSIREIVTIAVEGPGEEPPPEEVPPEEPPPAEPPPEEPPPEEGPSFVVLWVIPEVVAPGGCARLHWEVHPPDWPVFLNGEEVKGFGEDEECPAGTTTYELTVEAPGRVHHRSVTLRVEGGGPGPEPTPQPPTPSPQPPAPSPQAPAATPQPPAPSPQPSPTPLSADLAMTDLYADKLQNGTVYGRITNRGPGTIVNVLVNFSCEWGKTEYGATLGLHEQMGPRNMTITGPLPPGQDTPFATYIAVDLIKFWYNMTCTVNVPFNDPDTGNNTYNETLAKP